MESVARHLALPLADVMTPFALGDADALCGLFTAAGFKQVGILSESTVVRFPVPERFVPLAVASSAAAVPAFTQLQAPSHATSAVRSSARSPPRCSPGEPHDGDWDSCKSRSWRSVPWSAPTGPRPTALNASRTQRHVSSTCGWCRIVHTS